MVFLKQVKYKLPNINRDFTTSFLKYLSAVGGIKNEELTLRVSNNNFIPSTRITFTDIIVPQVSFIFSDSTMLNVEIANTTGQSISSPHQYSRILINDFIKRVTPFKLKYIDHSGFNLPYFEGIHPKILELREKLKSVSLYHTFPKHLEDAPWDFILPAREDEISRIIETDYSLNRKPKIEIVSFSKCSTPLIQFDIHLEGSYTEWDEIFPEAIAVPEAKNLWVYIQNNFGIDVCFVLNEVHDTDWSYHFAKDRLS